MKTEYDKDFERVMNELQTNFGWSNIEILPDSYKELLNDTIKAVKPCVSHWVLFDFMKLETRPQKYGKYLICRKDGKIHWETWNGSGWAYNHNEIRYWAEIKPPCL